MEDLISRKVAIDEIKALYEWHDTVTEDRTIDHLKRLPSAQTETHEERTETHACDCIERQAVIDAMEGVDWYHIDSDGQLTHGANSKNNEPLYKAEDVYKVLNDMPSAQPEIIRCKDCKWHQGAECVRFAEVRPFADDFCSRAERRTDG